MKTPILSSQAFGMLMLGQRKVLLYASLDNKLSGKAQLEIPGPVRRRLVARFQHYN
jgi:hypothetical protein